LDVRTDDGATPVVAAAQNGHVEVVRLLVGKGADVKMPWKQGITALFLAAQVSMILQCPLSIFIFFFRVFFLK
jgi:ankyrin repeat protein